MIRCQLLLRFCLVGLAPFTPAHAAESKSPPQREPLQLEETVTPLAPKQVRTQAEHDHLRALALFAAGRVAQQRGNDARALRLYERALRYDPDAVPVLREIVPLAFTLDRPAEAVRYALMVVEKQPSDPVLLRRLGLYLTEEGDWERALKLYQKAAALQAGEKPSAGTVLLWMEIGRLYFLTKKFDLAAGQFERVVRALRTPKDFGIDDALQKSIIGDGGISYQLFGECFLEAGRIADAKAVFQKANEIKSDDGTLAYNLARVESKQKQPAQALQKLQTYFDKRLTSQGTAAYELLVELLTELGQQNQLLERLEKMRAADPANIPLGYFLAQRYEQAEQFEKAEAIYTYLVKKHDKQTPLEVYRGLVEVYRRAKRPDALLAALGQIAARAGSLAPLGEPAKSLAANRELVDSLLAAAHKRQAASPAQLGYGESLAAALLSLERQQYDVARRYFDLAIKLEPKKAPELLLTWGLQLFASNQYAEAVKVFQRGVDEAVLPSDNPAFYFYLAGALELQGSTDKALEAARKAAQIQPSAPRFLSRVAWILYHAKRYDDAKKQYQAVIEKFDSVHDPEVREVLRDARLVLSNIEVLQNNFVLAEEWLEQVLDEFPEDVGALNDLGYLWTDQNKNLDRALRMIQRAVAAEPQNMAYRDSLGWAFYRLGRYAEAVAELKTAASVKDPDAVILDHLGDALLKNGDAAGARDAWSRAVRIFEQEAEIEKARETQEKITRAGAKPAQPPPTVQPVANSGK